MNSIIIAFAGIILYISKIHFIKMSDDDYKRIKKYCQIYLGIFLILMTTRLHRKPYFELHFGRNIVREEIQNILPKLQDGKKIYFYFDNYTVHDCQSTLIELVPYSKQTNIKECDQYHNNNLQQNILAPKEYDYSYRAKPERKLSKIKKTP